MAKARKFPPPWTVDEKQESFIVRDGRGQMLACFYFEDEPQRQVPMKRLSRDEEFLLAINFVKLPSVPRKILQDIPRPKHNASEE